MERHSVESDRRVVRISATAHGRKVLGDLDRAIEAMLARLTPIEPIEMRALVVQLDAVRERLAIPTAREGVARKQKGA